MNDLISRQAAIDCVTVGAKPTTIRGRIAELPSAEPRWIPVTERLPEYGIDVLTDNGYGDYELNHIVGEEDGEWYWEPVAAWMPLPEPWKGEADDAD